MPGCKASRQSNYPDYYQWLGTSVLAVVRAVAAHIHPFILEEKHTVRSKHLKGKLFEVKKKKKPHTHTKCYSKHNPVCLQYESTFTFTLHSVVTSCPLINDDVEGNNYIKQTISMSKM